MDQRRRVTANGFCRGAEEEPSDCTPDKDSVLELISCVDTYSVGIGKFDLEHQQIFDCANEIERAMLDGAENSLLLNAVRRVALLVREHFASEEEMMGRMEYPDFEIHRLIHHLLGANLDFYVERFEKGEVVLNSALLDFLRSWLVKHIQGMDQGYTAFLNSHGVF